MRLELDKKELDLIVEKVAEKVIAKLAPLLNAPSESQDTLLNMKELCDYLKVKPAWVYSNVHSGDLPHCKTGNKLLFKKSEINEYLISHRHKNS